MCVHTVGQAWWGGLKKNTKQLTRVRGALGQALHACAVMHTAGRHVIARHDDSDEHGDRSCDSTAHC